MSIWVKLPPTAALLAFGVIVYISPTCELNVFCSYYASILLFAFPFLLCQNLCWQNQPIPTYQVRGTEYGAPSVV